MGRNISDLARALGRGELIAVRAAVALALVAGAVRIGLAVNDHSVFVPVAGGTYAEGAIGQPTDVNPLVSANPVDQDIAALVFSPLKDLTDGIERDADGRTYRVTLREDLSWDDGEPLTSDDIVFSIRLIQNPASRSPLARAWEGVTVERVSALKATFTLKDPYAFFEDQLAALRAIPRHIYGAVPPVNFALSEYALRPVGSGPYRVEGFAAKRDGFVTEYRLEPNDRYAGAAPFIDEFSFRFYQSEAELLDAFRLREVQGSGWLAPLPDQFRNLPGVRISELPMPRYYAVFINQLSNPALAEKRIREALSLAVDRQALVREAFGGIGEPVASPVVPGTLDDTASTTLPRPAFDRERARELLAATDLDSLTLTLVVPRVPFLEATAQSLKESWAAVGVSVSISPVEPGEFADRVLATRNYDLALFGNILQNPFDLFPFWHSRERFAPGANLSVYQNKDVDAALERIRAGTLTGGERDAELARAAGRIAADSPAVFLVSTPYIYAHTDRLDGFSAPRIVIPADRFASVSRWSVARARMLE